jgi:hypothetical protein
MWTFYSEIIVACMVALLAYLNKKLGQRKVSSQNFFQEVKENHNDQNNPRA